MKLLNYISYFTLLLTFGVLVVVGYWLIHPYQPIVFNKLPFKVDKKVIKAGEELTYNIDYCKHNSIIPNITRYFVDEIVYLLPPVTALAKNSGCHTNKILVSIPPTLPPSTYYLKLNYRYQVNPIRTIDVIAETEKFEVIK